MVEVAGCKEPIDSKLTKYENRNGEACFLRRSDSGNERFGDGFPAFDELV